MGEAPDVMQKPEQLKAALIGRFASIQDRTEEAVHALGQPTASPSPPQHGAYVRPCLPQHMVRTTCGHGCIQACHPQPLASLLLG